MAGMDDEEEKKAPKMTAEQRRLNPMAAAGGSSKPLTAEQRRLNPMAGAGGGGKAMAAAAAKQALANTQKRSVVKSDFSREFQQKSFTDSRDKIIELSKKSGLRGVNAREVARDLRRKLREQSEFNFEEFKAVVEPKIARRAQSSISMQIYEVTLREIFNLFDADQSNTVDAQELANCMAIMCGGSMSDKINAAFILFDQNNSGTMSFDELAALIKTVFNLVNNMLEIAQKRGVSYAGEGFPTADFPAMAVETAKKAFGDL